MVEWVVYLNKNCCFLLEQEKHSFKKAHNNTLKVNKHYSQRNNANFSPASLLLPKTIPKKHKDIKGKGINSLNI